MAEKKAKTAQKVSLRQRRACPSCNAESKVVEFAGFGKRGNFWVCESDCGYIERTR